MLPKILIVDDDPDMVELLSATLTQSGYSVQGAADGAEARASAQRCVPDLVLLDVILPDVNGFTICEEFRRDPITSSVPILMMTVLPGEFPRMTGMELGANDYLHKPFELKELIARVAELLQQNHRHHGILAAA